MANQTAPKRRVLELGGVRVLDSDRFDGDGRHIGPWELKAYAACDLAPDYDMIISIDSNCVLCAGVGDTAYRARATVRLAGGRDGDGPTYDETYARYGIQPGEHNPNYTSTSGDSRHPGILDTYEVPMNSSGRSNRLALPLSVPRCGLGPTDEFVGCLDSPSTGPLLAGRPDRRSYRRYSRLNRKKSGPPTRGQSANVSMMNSPGPGWA
jgi:hypothetical protein